MAKLALNKSALSKEKQKQAAYGKYLPSLELKQKQLLLERKKAEQALIEHRELIEKIQQDVYQRLPMLALRHIQMEGLVKVDQLDIQEENVLGTLLPSLKKVEYRRARYSYLARPHWVDEVANALEQVIRLKLEEEILQVRAKRLNKAVRTITQRVNLFSKVLIPDSKKNIKRIGLFLSDQERAAVVRSKLAKQKHQA
ncbi:V-type ATP synthase subunit D [Alkalimarinus coralli]|uniref:V-type ATP synthase subunit D n=1 Tax=Alkalimarinus coralli TaxID=2935863 RepID=UPI00202B347D|nr:V-type ATP synthase subunit D [Alkalimarinus coralli]